MFVSRRISDIDKKIIDSLIDGLALATRKVANVWDAVVDRRIVDGLFNGVAYRTWDVGLALRVIQTGKLRQYVMFIVIGTVAMLVLVSIVCSYTLAG